MRTPTLASLLVSGNRWKLRWKLYSNSAQYIRLPRYPLETGEVIQKIKHESKLCHRWDRHKRYYSLLKSFTIVTQVEGGENLKFVDVATGFPGGYHDGRVLRKSSLFNRAQSPTILAKPLLLVDGRKIRPLLLADGAYPCLTCAGVCCICAFWLIHI